MKIFNTLTRQKEEFVPLEPGKVKMYACGPTVYNFIHIGNARPICIFDTLRRYLEFRGYDVTFVQNFTDIDDKVINKANEEGVTYDDARYEVVVTVADDGEGNLAAAVESNAGEEGLVFENAYAAPADPEPAPLPPADDGDGATLVKTGDAAPTAPLVGGALAAAAALALAGRKLVRVPLRRDR